MTMFAPMVPALTVLVLVLVSVMPWGIGPGFHFALPAMPLLAVYFWARAQSRLLPTVFVFAAGLVVDVLSYGPLGYWSLVYVAGLGLAGLSARFGGGGNLSQWFGFAVVMAGLALLAWLLASVYFVRFIDWRPMAWAAAVLPLAYPFVQALLGPVDRWMAGPRALNLERRI